MALSIGLYPVGEVVSTAEGECVYRGRRDVQSADRGGGHPREPVGSETLSLNSQMGGGKMGVGEDHVQVGRDPVAMC